LVLWHHSSKSHLRRVPDHRRPPRSTYSSLATAILAYFLLFSGQPSATVPKHDNRRLNALLKEVLATSPNSRPSAEEISVHPYFTVSTVAELKRDGQLIDTTKKFEAFRSFVTQIRILPPGTRQESKQLRIAPDYLVQETLNALGTVESLNPKFAYTYVPVFIENTLGT